MERGLGGGGGGGTGESMEQERDSMVEERSVGVGCGGCGGAWDGVGGMSVREGVGECGGRRVWGVGECGG